MKILPASLIAIPLGFLGLGSCFVWSQHHRISTFHPVQALVLSSRIEGHSTPRYGTTYWAMITYRYQVDGRTYTSSQLQVQGSESGDRAEAAEIVARYPAETSVEAWYDPADPADAFLIREHSFLPYCFTLIAFPVLAFILSVLRAVGLAEGAAAEPRADPGGGFEVAPVFTTAGWARMLLVVAALWQVGGVAGLGHFVAVAEHPFTFFPVLFAVVYEVLGAGTIVAAVVLARARRHLGEARVWVSVAHPAAGTSFDVRVEQEVGAELRIRELRLGLVCEETTGRSARPVHQDSDVVIRDQRAAAGTVLRATKRFPMPASFAAPATGSATRAWWIEVATQGELGGPPGWLQPAAGGGSVRYRRRFPVRLA